MPCGGLRFGFKGVNLICPHKIAAVPYLDELSEAAEIMGAVNCIQRVDSKLVGENTDGQAFVDSLAAVSSIADKES